MRGEKRWIYFNQLLYFLLYISNTLRNTDVSNSQVVYDITHTRQRRSQMAKDGFIYVYFHLPRRATFHTPLESDTNNSHQQAPNSRHNTNPKNNMATKTTLTPDRAASQPLKRLVAGDRGAPSTHSTHGTFMLLLVTCRGHQRTLAAD